MIRHPNNSGLQRDQVLLLYIALFIVRKLRVWQGDQLVLEMDGGISISENPNIHFSFMPTGANTFRAEAQDTEGHVFKNEWPVEAMLTAPSETADFRLRLRAAQILDRRTGDVRRTKFASEISGDMSHAQHGFRRDIALIGQ
jgi:hypothetical protein